MRWEGQSDAESDKSHTTRTPIPRGVKNQLFMAQKGRCFYCGRTNRIRYLEVDHKYPFSRGGGGDIDNLQLLCTPCNMRKGIQSDEEFRHRYHRLLPTGGGIPNPPISQDAFADETQHTRASREVRAIYHRRFSAYRGSQRDGCGLILVATALTVIVLAVLAIAL